MSRPPIAPTRSPVKPDMMVSYFEHLMIQIGKILKEDNSTIQLNFKGFRELLSEYSELKIDSYEKAWELARDFNMWAEYFSGIANLIQKEYLDSETKKTELQSIASFDADSTKVANGDRLSNKDERVVKARNSRNAYKAFYDELMNMLSFLERGHYHCKSTYEMAKTLKDKDF